MPLSAFLLALAAAVLHAGWNVLLARARDVAAATTVALVLAVLLFAPVAAATWDVDASAVPWIAASAALEIVYFVFLTTAYSRSDLSLVYPVARGSAPVLVLAGAAVTGATIGLVQALGVLLVGGGILLVRGMTGQSDARGLLLALGIGAAIAGYTLVDKQGVEHAAVIPYFELVLAPVALAAMVWLAAMRRLPAARARAGLGHARGGDLRVCGLRARSRRADARVGAFGRRRAGDERVVRRCPRRVRARRAGRPFARVRRRARRRRRRARRPRLRGAGRRARAVEATRGL